MKTIFITLLATAILIAKVDYIPVVKELLNDLNLSSQKKIISTAIKMVEDKEIIKGSCWDFINEVYKRAGFNQSKRETIFKSSKKGPYANLNLLRAGDWIYHINHSYHNIEHSGLFIKWIDFNTSKALMLSYRGENSNTPARFRIYKIDQTFNIIRAKEKSSNKNYLTQKIKNNISKENIILKDNDIKKLQKEIKELTNEIKELKKLIKKCCKIYNYKK